MLIPELHMVEVVEMPEVLEQGVLYVSRRFQLAIHLCACGCGIETVTPLSGPNAWTLSADGTLYPSIGNMNFPCRSHYWVTELRVVPA